MKLYMYEKGKGLSITELPEETEGQIEIRYSNIMGKRSKLLDVEGDSRQWRAYSTIQGRIYIDGDFCEDVVLENNLLMTVETENGSVTILCSESNASVQTVRFYQLPMNGIIRIGSKNSEIKCEGTKLIASKQAEIHIRKEEMTVDCSTNGAGTYINYLYGEEETPLQPGSILDIFGLRIVILNRMIAVWPFCDKVTTSISLTPCEIMNRQQKEGKYNKHMIPDLGVNYERSPRIGTRTVQQAIDVEAPPPKPAREEMPLIFSVGSSAFMSISSVMMAMNTITTAQATGAGIGTVLPTVFMAAGMFAGSLLMPVFTRRHNNKRADEKEKIRQEKYKEYLHGIDDRITKAGEKQKTELLENYLPPETLVREASARSNVLWSHMPFHDDFLSLRLGLGQTEPSLDVRYPAHNFTLEEDEMRRTLEKLEEKKHLMNDVPMMLSLNETGILGVIAEREECLRWVKGLLIQLCTYHSYKELKLVLIYDKTEESQWEFARWLPHVWSDNGEFRAIGTAKEDIRDISSYIDSICPVSERQENEYNQMCVVVLADNKLGEQCYALQSRMEHIENSNMRVIALASRANELPKECNSVVVLDNGQGALSYGIRSLKKQTLFNCDPIPEEQIRPFATGLLNTHLSDIQGEGQLIDMLTMLDMLRCGNVEQLNIPERWQKSNPVKTLAAPVGIDKYGAMLNLDIHQDAHGPHGLVAGMTGSGKSEFIITYILSMAINYSPQEVGFILIDYKGGGMSDTLAALPHVIGVIDNLGGSQGIRRSLVSIKSEIIRRQMVFKEISEKKHISNMDIYKYQAMYRNGELSEPMQHLILISDEFAELKEQESDFMDDIVSMARIGRSLGVHLILATQKPTGVVSPQIASNARFHICLKVQDRSDSMEILARPEAAMLTKTGRFYLQVGFNEIFEMGQSAWCGAEYNPKPMYVEEPDYSFELLNDLGQTIARVKPNLDGQSGSKVKQVDALVQYLREMAEKLEVMPPKGWKPSLPDVILLDDIDQQYQPEYRKYALDPTIGVIDDPKHQDQYPLRLNFNEEGNAIVYGFAGAGKHEIINAVIYSLCKHHTAEEINIYCLDFGSETARMFAAMPQVGDIIVSGDDEKMTNFVRTMTDEMESRRKKLASFGGNIHLYREEKDDPMPSILITVDNYAGLLESYPELEDDMFRLIREGNRFGIWFLITSLSSTTLRYRLTQNFKQVLCLQLMDKMEYVNVLGKTEGNEPMSRLGSGLIKQEEVLEFQAGFLFGDQVTNEYQQMTALSRKASEEWTGVRAPRIRVLPDHVKVSDVCDAPEMIRLEAVPLGIDKESMMPVCKDLTEEYIFPILYSIQPETSYVQIIADALAANENRQVYFIDTGKKLNHMPQARYQLCSQADTAKETVEKLYNLSVERHNRLKELEKAGAEPETFSETVVFVTAINELFELLKDDEMASAKLDAVLKMGRTEMQMNFVMIQEARTVTSLSLHPWYDRIPDREGIWLGDGIQMQNVLKSDVRYNQTADDQFAFFVRRGKARTIKVIEERR